MASAGQTTTCSAIWRRRLGFEPELFPDDEKLIREVLSGGPALSRESHLSGCEPRGPVRLNIPETLYALCRRSLSDAVGQMRALFRADEGRRVRPVAGLHAAARGPADASRPGCALSLAIGQPAAAAVPQLDLRQLARHRAAAGDPEVELAAEDALKRGLTDGQWAMVYNDRGRFLARFAPTAAFAPEWPLLPASTGTSSVRGAHQRQQYDVFGTHRHGGWGDVF